MVEAKALDVTTAIAKESQAFSTLQRTTKECVIETQSTEMLNRHSKYQSSVNDLQWQIDVLSGLSQELSLSNEDKGQLFEVESVDSKQLVEESIGSSEFAANQQLAQLHTAFFHSLERVNRI